MDKNNVKNDILDMFVLEGKEDDNPEIFEPEKSYTILTHNVSAILNYAKSTGKRVSELTQEEIDQFKIEKRN